MRALGVGLVTAVAIGFGATYSDHAALLPLLAADLGLSDAQAGLLSAALFVAYIATTLLTSGVPDRIGPKRAIGVGLAVSIAGTAIFAAANGFPVLLAAKAGPGVGSALAFVAAARYIAGLYGTAQPHFALGLYRAGFPLGSALALLATPTVAATIGGWRASFGLEAVAPPAGPGGLAPCARGPGRAPRGGQARGPSLAAL